MEEHIKIWCEKNNVLFFQILKGTERIYKSSGTDPNDSATQIIQQYERLGDGNYKILGKVISSTTDAGCEVFPFSKSNTQTFSQATTMQGNAPQGYYTEQQLQDKLALQKKEMQFEFLSNDVIMLKKEMTELTRRFEKLADAVSKLLDDDSSNDQTGLEKLSEFATTAKTMFPNLKL